MCNFYEPPLRLPPLCLVPGLFVQSQEEDFTIQVLLRARTTWRKSEKLGDNGRRRDEEEEDNITDDSKNLIAAKDFGADPFKCLLAELGVGQVRGGFAIKLIDSLLGWLNKSICEKEETVLLHRVSGKVFKSRHWRSHCNFVGIY